MRIDGIDILVDPRASIVWYFAECFIGISSRTRPKLMGSVGAFGEYFARNLAEAYRPEVPR